MENVKKWWAPILMIAFGVIGLALGLTAVIKEIKYLREITPKVITMPMTPNQLFSNLSQFTDEHDSSVVTQGNMMFIGGAFALVLGLGSMIAGLVFTIKTKNDNVSNVKVMYGLVVLPVVALALGIGAIICNANLGSLAWWEDMVKNAKH